MIQGYTSAKASREELEYLVYGVSVLRRLVKHKRPSFLGKEVNHFEDLVRLRQTSLLIHMYAHHREP